MTIGNPVIFLLSQFGKLKSCRIAPSFDELSESIICYPPSVIWWYENTGSKADMDILIEKIAEFPGEFTWIIKNNLKRWMFYPSFLEDISQQRNENLGRSSAYVMINKPELGIKANLEFRKLIEFLRQEIIEESIESI
ncbi:MAG TPA: hypothetical protein V6C84_07385 [Coleofasciculaceae cyanobacterium]|jgi:hypothetical protein